MGRNEAKIAREITEEEVERIYEMMNLNINIRASRFKSSQEGPRHRRTSAKQGMGSLARNIENSPDNDKYWKVFEQHKETNREMILANPDSNSLTFGRDRAMMTFLLKTGLRIGEVVKLTVGQVFQHGQVCDQFPLEKAQTKRNKAGWVFINDELKKVLADYLCMYHLRSVPVTYAYAPQDQSNPWMGFQWDEDVPLFPSSRYEVDLRRGLRRPKAMTSIAAANVFKAWFTKAGIENASSHSFRRTFANRLRRKGVDVKVIQDLLRHSHLNTTMKYLQADQVELSKAVENI
jgi:integrase/recombinase XerD